MTEYDGSTDMTNANEPQYEEVTEEEKRRWDEEEDEERRRDQTNNEQDEGKAEEPSLSDSLVSESLAQEGMIPDLFPQDIKA